MAEPTAVSPKCPYGAGGFELADPALYSDGDPHAVWRDLRATDPVSRQQAAGGHHYWSITKYDDADRVLRDHATFTSERGTLLFLLGKEDPAGGQQMAATDPPRHTSMRQPLQHALTIKRLDHDRERIRQAVLGLILPLADGGAYDLARHMTKMPMAVIGTLMALPPDDWPRLTELTLAAIAPDAPEYGHLGGTEAVLKAAHRELFAYFQDLIRERKRVALGDDLISLLLKMRLDGQALTAGEIVSNCYSLLLGASVTMAQVPVSAFAELMGTPALDDWASHQDLLTLGLEEALRWSSPTSHFMRHTTRDVVIRDKLVPAGDPVVVWLGSANRDEDVFLDPYRFDIRRRPNKHVAFGVGPHYCVGHNVARVTLKVVFAELFSRFTDFAPAGQARRLRSNVIAGLTELPIEARARREPFPIAY